MPVDAAVALLAEGVDRNHSYLTDTGAVIQVALLAEGVDRNTRTMLFTRTERVALLAEGVDRNQSGWCFVEVGHMSPSSRRAWIEIPRCGTAFAPGIGRPPRGGRG